MKFRHSVSVLSFWLLAQVWTQAFWGYEDGRKSLHGKVWESSLSDFSVKSYRDQARLLIQSFEKESGKQIKPGAYRKAGLKIYTQSGPGLCTPHALTEAVIDILVENGFERSELFIFDLRENNLRHAGYLPPVSRRDSPSSFAGVPVYALDSGKLTDPAWFYDSPLPEEFTSPLGRELLRREQNLDPETSRKSFLPAPILTDVDFWINLPVVVDQYAVGMIGATVNATLWNVTNQTRFFGSPVNAPVAVAEICAIPELQNSWAFTLLSLEQYQFIGGHHFNANYTVSEPLLWLSTDPIILDTLMVERVNRHRTETGFRPLPEILPYVNYSVNLGLGHGLVSLARWTRPDPKP